MNNQNTFTQVERRLNQMAQMFSFKRKAMLHVVLIVQACVLAYLSAGVRAVWTHTQ